MRGGGLESTAVEPRSSESGKLTGSINGYCRG
jgi:hypothetical protein